MNQNCEGSAAAVYRSPDILEARPRDAVDPDHTDVAMRAANTSDAIPESSDFSSGGMSK